MYKLCNNREVPKKGEPGCDPAYKFDMIYDVLTSNVNAINKYAGLDLCGDESTWGHNGYGVASSGLVSLILNKPGITRGGQVVIVSDVDRIRPRAYLHRHKLHENAYTSQGPSEV